MTVLDDDAALSRVLASVGRHLATDDLAADTVAARRPVRREPPWAGHRRLVVGLAAAVIVVAAVVAITPVRRAVADWLGIGSTTVVHVPGSAAPQPSLPPITAGLRTIEADEAVRRLGRPLPDTTGTALGAADELLAMPEGGVLLVWRDGATTLWVHAAQMPAPVLVKKLLTADQPAEVVPGLGDGALAITGDHVLVTPHRTVAAGTVLLWTQDSTEWRLESDLPLAEMTAIAEQLA